MEHLELENKTIFIKGAAGFIGASLSKALLDSEKTIRVVGFDNQNDYYDVRLKEERLKLFMSDERFVFVRGDLAEKEQVFSAFETYKPEIVVHLGAQAGVRYSIVNPDSYVESNLIGFYNMLEGCRRYPVLHLVFASSSSVYGNSPSVPYRTDQKTDSPVSLYAATKKSNELLAYAYSVLYQIPSTGLRFFTVYGPMGRPDMAYFSFTDKLLKGEPIQIFNFGECRRDFTYIDDVVAGLIAIMKGAPKAGRAAQGEAGAPPYALYNLGNSSPESLLEFVTMLKEELVRAGLLPEDFKLESHVEYVPMQPGDVETTYADTGTLERDFGFKPGTPLRDGLRKFVEWYREFYKNDPVRNGV